MGRYILCGKEARIPYEVEELNLRLYTIEELCYFIYHNMSMIDDDFIDDRLLHFIRKECDMPELADKIRKYYVSPSDLDATLMMLLREVGYYTESELQNFQRNLSERRRKNGPERVRDRAAALMKEHRYQEAVRYYKYLVLGTRDGRMPARFYLSATESLANAYGRLCEFDQAFSTLSRLYDQTKSERVLKKMYDTAVLSGMELPENYFSQVPEATLKKWQQNYWNREALRKDIVSESEEMQMFLKPREKVCEDLLEYVERKKEEYRGMLE